MNPQYSNIDTSKYSEMLRSMDIFKSSLIDETPADRTKKHLVELTCFDKDCYTVGEMLSKQILDARDLGSSLKTLLHSMFTNADPMVIDEIVSAAKIDDHKKNQIISYIGGFISGLIK